MLLSECSYWVCHSLLPHYFETICLRREWRIGGIDTLYGWAQVRQAIRMNTCGSGALAAITGRTRGATGLIAARAPLPQRKDRFDSQQLQVSKWTRFRTGLPAAATDGQLPCCKKQSICLRFKVWQALPASAWFNPLKQARYRVLPSRSTGVTTARPGDSRAGAA